MILSQAGNYITSQLKQQAFIPFKSGHLKHDALDGRMITKDTYQIKFDTSIAEYITYLEEGTTPHDIPFAFVGSGNWVWWYPYNDGVPFLMGTGGRFNGKFHPGSTKHVGFIKDKSVKFVVDTLISKYGAQPE